MKVFLAALVFLMGHCHLVQCAEKLMMYYLKGGATPTLVEVDAMTMPSGAAPYTKVLAEMRKPDQSFFVIIYPIDEYDPAFTVDENGLINRQALENTIKINEDAEKAAILLVRLNSRITVDYVTMAQKLQRAAASHLIVRIKTLPDPLLDAVQRKEEFVYYIQTESFQYKLLKIDLKQVANQYEYLIEAAENFSDYKYTSIPNPIIGQPATTKPILYLLWDREIVFSEKAKCIEEYLWDLFATHNTCVMLTHLNRKSYYELKNKLEEAGYYVETKLLE